MLAPASWLFVVVALVLIGVLTYYLTLTTRPEISQISPAPNSEQVPGVIELEAIITSPRDIDSAELAVDGHPEIPAVDQQSESQWRVSFEDIFERGERKVALKVTDSSGRTAEHSWTFISGGDLIPPRLALMSPPSDFNVAPGTNGIQIQATTFAEIDEVEVKFDGGPVHTEIEALETSTEYTNDEGLPIFEWEIRARTRLSSGSTVVEASISDVHGAVEASEWTIDVSFDEDSATARYFDQTGEYAIEPFLTFWDENKGAETIGAPVGPPIAEGNGEVHQYFRYARLELHEDGDVHRGLIGREIFGPPENPPDRPPGDNSQLFDPTGHYIYGTIRDFWEDNGGLMNFGYPLSQEFDTEHGYAQYFERALIEVIVLGSHEIVELVPLGQQLYENRIPEGVPDADDVTEADSDDQDAMAGDDEDQDDQDD